MRALRLLLTSAVVLAVSSSPALAGALVLHPSGFGEHSYSAWKGGEGLPDSVGSKNQALYFQKMTTTATFAAGVAVFKGFEGMPASSLGDLSFYWRMDGHCGAGAPRFNVRTDAVPGTIFFGCAAMVPGETLVAPNGTLYQKKTLPGSFLPPGNVVSLSILFDEGNDVGQGFVYLDNITVGGHLWTSASDNGNGETIESSSVPLVDLLGAPLESLFQ